MKAPRTEQPATVAGSVMQEWLTESAGYPWRERVRDGILAIEAEAALALLERLAMEVEHLTLFDADARTMADAAESMQKRAIAILDAALAAAP